MRDEHAKTQDRQFFTRFGLILATLVVFMLICIWIARKVAPSRTEFMEAVNSPEAIAGRISPEGQILAEGEELPPGVLRSSIVPVAQPVSAPASASPEQAGDASGEEPDGEAVYVQACQLCHAIELAGAPRPGDEAAWAPRLKQGIDTLYRNSLNGIRGMPARGGRADLSDAQVKAAVDHMLSVR